MLRRALPGTTVLRPAAYHQNLLAAAHAGRIEVEYALTAPFSNVDLDDVAEVAARVLTGAGHDGATYELAGPERLTVAEMAEIATRVLGVEVSAVRVPTADRVGPSDLDAMFAAYDRSGFVGSGATLRRLLGREPTTWGQALAAVAATGCADPR